MPAEDPGATSGPDRLDSWKEIAAYLKRGVTTVQRWERTEGLPVHRLPHARAGSVYAFRSELDSWWAERSANIEPDEAEAVAPGPVEDGPPALAPDRSWPVSWKTLAMASIAGLAVLLASIVSTREEAAVPGRVMLAVLPFQSLEAGEEHEYLASGVTEEMITALARVNPERLGVIARTSVEPYRARQKTLREIASDLGVTHLIEGSVRRSAGRLRLTAQLIEARGQTVLWAGAYDEDPGGARRAEIEAAQEVSRRLSIRPLPRAGPSQPPPRPEARSLYLKGLYFLNKRSEPSLRRAIELFGDAVAAEPGYARAHAGLASAHALLSTSADALDAALARRQAEEEARRALAIDPQLSEGHAALSVVYCRFDWNWSACEQALERALALDPNSATSHLWLGEHLTQRGRFAQAAHALERAHTLDPISPNIHAHLGINAMYARRYDEALSYFDQALEIDPGFLLAQRTRGLTLLRAGRPAEALEVLRQARAASPGSAHAAADLAYALARAGGLAEARALLSELAELARRRRVSAYDFAVVHAGLGETQAALAALERGLDEKATGVRWLKVEPIFDELRAEPRFATLVRKVGLPD